MCIHKGIQKFLASTAAVGLLLCGASAYAYDAEFDYNDDGVNDAADLELIDSAFNTQEADPDFDPTFDHDGDGFIGGTDVMAAQEAVGGDSQ